jgi:hypothetical protein
LYSDRFLDKRCSGDIDDNDGDDDVAVVVAAAVVTLSCIDTDDRGGVLLLRFEIEKKDIFLALFAFSAFFAKN